MRGVSIEICGLSVFISSSKSRHIGGNSQERRSASFSPSTVGQGKTEFPSRFGIELEGYKILFGIRRGRGDEGEMADPIDGWPDRPGFGLTSEEERRVLKGLYDKNYNFYTGTFANFKNDKKDITNKVRGELGAGRVPQLAGGCSDLTAERMFVVVKHGIRYSGMASWNGLIPESDMWRVVTFLSRVNSLPLLLMPCGKANVRIFKLEVR